VAHEQSISAAPGLHTELRRQRCNLEDGSQLLAVLLHWEPDFVLISPRWELHLLAASRPYLDLCAIGRDEVSLYRSNGTIALFLEDLGSGDWASLTTLLLQSP
jgi:hypothetical protein